MTLAEFDFRRPPPGDIERNVTAWLTTACRRATEAASNILSFPLTVQLAGVETPSASACLALLPEGTVGVLLAEPVAGVGGVLLALPNTLLLALVSGLVGESPAALPPQREATVMELSLVPHLVTELFANPLLKSWQGNEPPALAVGLPSVPGAVWRAGTERTLFATITLSAAFGDHQVHLLFNRTGRWEELAIAPPDLVTPVPREEIESLVRAMAVEMTVVLGKADLTMHDLAGLVAGDVVVFDQKVTQPLDGLVAGARKFRVWPGVVGDRAAVVVDAVAAD